jgi:hypothetical protein
MASAQVVLRGRFKPGSFVRLVRVAHEGVLRSEGGEEVATATVDEDGEVKFGRGVDEGARYLVSGLIDGFPVEVRARGRAKDDPDITLEQPPVKADRVRLSDGSWADEPPERERTPSAFIAPGPAQHQVPKGTVQRSDTARGSAHPNDPREVLPYPDQRSVKRGTVQMSDTESGLATPVVDTPERQDQVPAGVWQRSRRCGSGSRVRRRRSRGRLGARLRIRRRRGGGSGRSGRRRVRCRRRARRTRRRRASSMMRLGSRSRRTSRVRLGRRRMRRGCRMSVRRRTGRATSARARRTARALRAGRGRKRSVAGRAGRRTTRGSVRLGLGLAGRIGRSAPSRLMGGCCGPCFAV